MVGLHSVYLLSGEDMTPKCKIHSGHKMELKPNRQSGGLFWGCTTWEHTGCKFTMSADMSQTWNDPTIVARKSENRSRCSSLRSWVIAMFSAEGFSKDETEKFIDSEGIHVAKLFISENV
jgi:hypothetical protein